jgi:transcriptional regulator with XRE-family HTH domain
MTLKQIFIHNLKEFRKKEGFSQMKLAEFCNTSPSYIGEIEIGRKFPSTEMIEKIAEVLRIEPYHLFKNRTEINDNTNIEKIYPLLPVSMKIEIKNQIDLSINEILNKY